MVNKELPSPPTEIQLEINGTEGNKIKGVSAQRKYVIYHL